jgi:fructose-1,6-bisphosphatase II
MRSISLDLLRVTEAGAIAASKFVGSGDKLGVDKAATEAIRHRFNKMDFAGQIIVGEGEKDKSYGLFPGECVGKRGTPHCGQDPSAASVSEYIDDLKTRPKLYDIAIDPVEGTTPTANSGPEAMSVVAVAEEGSMFSTPYYYMSKLAYGPKIAEKVELNLNDPLSRTIELVSLATGKPNNSIMVCVLNRTRHEKGVQELRDLGVRIKLIQDCDVSGGISACLAESEIDLLWGIGGSPEAVLTACAIKCLGGGLQAQIWDQETETNKGEILKINDLVKSECVFVATGITNGSLLKGVQWTKKGPVTHSVFMRSESGTSRWLTAKHGT